MDDDRIYSVNEVIADLDQLHGQTIRIGCILNLEFEGNGILHVPRREKRLDPDRSFLPAHFSPELIGLAAEPVARETYERIKTYLEPFRGRRVLVTATVDREVTEHMGDQPGGVVIRAIEKWKAS